MELIFTKEGHYGRSWSDEYSRLQQKLSAAYNAGTFILSSGMNAISTLLRVIFDEKKDYHLVYADELYTDLPRLFHYFERVNNVVLHPVTITDTSGIRQLLESLSFQNVVFYFETCSNPHGAIFSFDQIKSLKNGNPDLIVVVDNTWVTSAVFNPLDWGADFVVSSLTKYYSNSHSLGGFIASRSLLMNRVEEYIRFHGFHVSPYNCQIINENFDSLHDRMHRSYDIMMELLPRLTGPKFRDVTHPALESHPSHANYVKYFRNKNISIGPSVFTLRIKGNEKSIKKLFNGATHIVTKTSFGGKDTRCDPWHKKTSDGYTSRRISVGYDSTAEAIYNDLIR